MAQARAQSPEPQHSEPQMPRPYPGVGVREYGRIVGARGRFGLFVHAELTLPLLNLKKKN